MHARNSSLSSYLADRIGEIQEARLSNEDRLNVRQHLVDALASAFIGFRNLTVQKLIRLCPKTKEGCSWLGGGKKKVSPLDGGMVWAVAVNGSVFEDGSREGACHPGAVVIPTVIALSEGKDWDRIERAILAGYEVMVRMARGGNPEFTRRGFHPTAIVAPFGAAAAASVLSGYNPEQTRSALSLAAMGGAGLMVSFRRGETQPLQVGGSVRNGILAALIAGMGGSGFEAAHQGHFLAASAWMGRFEQENLGPMLIHNTFNTRSPKITDDLSLNVPHYEGGFLYPPDGPGLGVDLNEPVLQKLMTPGKKPVVVEL